MSIIAKRGKEAAKSATQEKQDFSKALVSFKSGTTLKVRVPSAEDFVEYYAHSIYKVITTTACTKPAGKPDLYDKAVEILFNDAKNEKDEKKAKELRDMANQLKARPKYLFGLFDLSTGNPIVIDVSKKQAQVLIAAIEKFEKKLDKLAFEVSKTGTGQSTTVTMTPILDMDEDLTETERKNFEATAGKPFPEEIYESVLVVKSESEQIEDLKAFGFDVSRLGVSAGDDVTPINDDDAAEPELDF